MNELPYACFVQKQWKKLENMRFHNTKGVNLALQWIMGFEYKFTTFFFFLLSDLLSYDTVRKV